MKVSKNHNLQLYFPEVAAEWHPSKNGDMTPDRVAPYTQYKAWWKCANGHEWKATIGSRTKGTDCPYCYGRYASAEYNLQVINPELARKSSEMQEGVEGCLSVPGMAGEVSRHRAVTVKGLNPHGRAVRIKADGMLARVFQHEIDHCDGLLFIDHIDDPEKIWPVKEGEEEAAERDQVAPDRMATSEPPE